MKNKKSQSKKSNKFGNILIAVCATAGIILAAIIAVFAVQAYMYTETEWKENEFGQFTYTNTDTVMNDADITVSIDSTDGTIGGDNMGSQSAVIKNFRGKDKKPVFVRAFVTMIIYSDSTQTFDVTPSYSQYVLNFTPGSGWSRLEDGYYYYNKVLRPSEKTSDLLQSVSISVDTEAYNSGFDNPLPDGAVIKIMVLADTVQAVSTDTSRWTTEDIYNSTEVSAAWHNVTKTISPSLESLTDDQKKQQNTNVTVEWKYTGGS